jgi:UDP-glucose:(heptosyl)LPS alpha-1,3-glucosyltransferase
MKVTLVRRGWSATGGAEAYLMRLAASLCEAGHEANLIGCGWPDEGWPYGKLKNLQASSPQEFARAFARLRREEDSVVLSLERVPGCDVFRAGDGVHAAWLERRKHFEPLWKSRLRFLNPKHRSLLELEKRVLDPNGTRFLIANSQLVADEISRFSGFPKERVFIVRNGFDPHGTPADKSRRNAARETMGISRDQFVALFVGSGWERKGLRHAIDATSRIAGITLLVAGKGQQKNFGGEHVLHLGPVGDLAQAWAAADLLLQPTWYDPFSNACLEGLAAGLPVITTRDNGFCELVVDGQTGSVVSRADATEEIVAALRYWRDAMAQNAVEIRDACFHSALPWSTRRNVEETLEILKRV